MAFVQLIEQACGGYLQCDRDLFKDRDGRVADAALDAADVGPVQPALEREHLLRDTERLAIFPEIEADTAPHIHAGMGAPLQRIVLQTISLIFLDLLAFASEHPGRGTT